MNCLSKYLSITENSTINLTELRCFLSYQGEIVDIYLFSTPAGIADFIQIHASVQRLTI
jgi:hypothetical protein